MPFMNFRYFYGLIIERELMKKKILFAVTAIILFVAAGCASQPHHGYVSKYPCHKIHPCCH